MANRLSALFKVAGLGAVAFLLVAANLPKVGDMAPPFAVTLIDGSKVTSDQLRGNVIILNFWATWCVPCLEELPLLDSYYRLRTKNGLKIFAVATQGSLPINRLNKLFAAMAIPSARKISGPYARVTAVPTNYIIDRSGRIRYAKAAAFTLDELNANLVPLLNEPVPPR